MTLQSRRSPTQRAPDWWESARFQAVCVAWSWFRQSGVVSSPHQRVTHTVRRSTQRIKMKVSITFTDDKPVMSIGGLHGTLMMLSGRTEHIVSKDPMNDTLSTWIHFSIVQEDNGWKFDYQSNCQYTREEDKRVIDDLLAKAKRAIIEKKTTDLSREFNALDNMQPYNFVGLYRRVNDHHEPFQEYHTWNQQLAEMRERLSSSLSPDEIESDKHLKSFVFQTPLETIWADLSSGTQRKDSA